MFIILSYFLTYAFFNVLHASIEIVNKGFFLDLSDVAICAIMLQSVSKVTETPTDYR